VSLAYILERHAALMSRRAVEEKKYRHDLSFERLHFRYKISYVVTSGHPLAWHVQATK